MSKEKNSLFFAIILGLNAVIGAGVFTMPLNVFKKAGPAGILSIALASLLILIIGLAFARISSFFKEEGNFFNYIAVWGGKNIALLGSSMYLIGLSIAIGLLVKYTSSIIFLYMTASSLSSIGSFIIIGSVVATIFASSIGNIGQKILLALTIIPLLIIAFLSFQEFSIARFYPFFTLGYKGVFTTIPSILFSFLGFESITSLSKIINKPEKNIPIATIAIIILTGILYIGFVGVVMGGLPSYLLLNKCVLSESLLYAFPKFTWLVHFINISIIITVLGTIYALMWSLSSLLKSIISSYKNNEQPVSDMLSISFIALIAFFSMRFIDNIDKIFNIVALCVVVTWALSVLLLVFKPKTLMDRLLGLISFACCFLIFISAIF